MYLSQRTCGYKCGIFQLCVDRITKEQQNRGKLLSFACRRSFRRCSTRGKLSHFPSARGSLASQTDVTPAISWRDFVARGRDFIAKSHRTETELLDREKLADTPRHTGDIACAIQLAREISGVTSVLDSLLWRAEQTPTSHTSDRRKDANQHSVGPRTPS